MKRPAIFFDRDNTLIQSDGYLGDPNGVRLIPGAADAVARARRMGFATIIFSNQSGVARGMFDENAVQAVNTRLDDVLQDENPSAIIDRHEYCPFHPEATMDAYRLDSDLRKPKPGMILRAAQALALDLDRSWIIGDAPRDIEAGKAAGCRAILFTAAGVPRSPAADESSNVEPDFVVSTLAEAIEHIEKQQHDAPPVEEPAADAPAAAESTPPVIEDPASENLQDAPSPNGAVSATTSDRPSNETPAVTSVPNPEIRVNPTPVQPIFDPMKIEASLARLEILTGQVITELRRAKEAPHTDFSVSKLLAGIVQVMALAALFLAYLNGGGNIQATLMVSLVLQTLTISLLIMGKQR